jgi:heat shock protein HslJ
MKIPFFFIVFIVNFNIFYAQASKIKNEHEYNLAAIFIGGQKNINAKNMATILFYTKFKKAKCSISCNLISLKYYSQSKKNIFRFKIETGTANTCPDHLIGLEADLKENLQKVTSLKVSNKNLFLFKNTDTLMIFND